MSSGNSFDVNQIIFSQYDRYQARRGQHHIYIRPSELLKWIEVLVEDLEYLTLVDITGVDLSGQDRAYRLEVIYSFLNMGTYQRLNIHVELDENEQLPSIKNFFECAEWLEREQAEQLGLDFNLKVASLLLPENQQIFPLRKNSKIDHWTQDSSWEAPKILKNPNKCEPPYPEEKYLWEKFDLYSPETLGNFEMMTCFDPTKVVDSKLRIGFYHQGLEKLFENRDWIQGMSLVDKLNLGIAPTYSIAWVKAIEEINEIKIPERAQAIRIITLELARVADHLTVLHEVTWNLELEESIFFLNCREKVYELFEKYIGRRQGYGVARIGGVSDDLPPGWIADYQITHDVVTKVIRSLTQSLIANSKLRSILIPVGVNSQTILSYGITGPAMRASGLNFDLRKSHPFYFYKDIDFDIPVGIHGSTFDRFLVRVEEIIQSFRIMTQVVDNLPLGQICAPELQLNYLELKKFLKDSTPVHDWHYGFLESPSGEAGVGIYMNDNLVPYRVKIKTPSFVLAQASPAFIQGLPKEQIPVCLAGLGISRFEMDR